MRKRDGQPAVFRQRWGLVGVVGALVLAACGSPAQPASPAEIGADTGRAPDFVISVYQGEDVLGGNEVRLSQVLAGGKPVVLNMWAGLCPPCRVEMPDLEAVYHSYQGRVVLFGLDVGPYTALGSREDGKALLRELEVTYPAGTTYDAQVLREYQIIGMPTTFFIKPSGQIVRKWTGLLTGQKLGELTEELLAASGTR